MGSVESQNSKVFVVVEFIDYLPNSIVTKTILKKATGDITAVSFDSGEVISERTSPFDTLIQVIDGIAIILINGLSNTVATGEFIIIPAHSVNSLKAEVKFKMIATTIKSGYEQLS